jgi:hypothetical protein
MKIKNSKTKAKTIRDKNTMRAEYDFRMGARGKHAARYVSGTNVVVLDPDVASIFPTAAEVNEALRALAQIIERRQPMDCR